MMVENTVNTAEGLSSVVEHKKKLDKPRKEKAFAKQSNKDEKEWSNVAEDDIKSDEEIESQHPVKETWDPKEFDEQTNNMDSWKESNGLRRVQDLPSPTLADVPPEQRSKQKAGAARRADSAADNPPVGPTRKVSKDFNDDVLEAIQAEDGVIEDGEENDRTQAWKMRETWKSSSHSKGSTSESSGHVSGTRKGRKADIGGRTSRPDASDDDDLIQDYDNSRPEKPKRKASLSRSADRHGKTENFDDDAEEIGVTSFHGLKKDADKKTTRSNSRGRKTPTGGRSGRTARNKTPTGGRPSRRKMKDKDVGQEEECSVESSKLKGDDSGTPSSSRSRERRRARQKALMEADTMDYETELTTIQAPRSAGRRPPTTRRSQMSRSSSERFRRAVEDDEEEEAIKMRARETLKRASNELSQSAHAVRRYHSLGGSLDRRSYHGTDYMRRGQSDMRRTPRRLVRNYDNVDSAGSFGGDSHDSYEDDGSVYSARTLESIEDFEDFTGMDFQTPGMVDFNAEVLDLMQRANPETTAHLDRRVNRKREQIIYDQNMPMMTRQALLTRQASAQAQRQVVDGNNVDRRRLLLRTDSMTSVNSHDDLTLSNHRSLRGAPGRRAPPRSRSSGLGAMVPGSGAPRPNDPENRRGVFRTRSSTATNSFKQYPNKPNRVQSITRRAPGDQIEPHSMRGPSSGDSLLRRRPLQRAKSTTSLRRASDHRVITPQKADSRLSRREDVSSDESGSDSEDSDVISDDEERTPSPRKPSMRTQVRKLPTRAQSDVLPRLQPVRTKSTDKKDMTNKRNRRKLHLLMYESKMGVEMKDLFKQVREGVAPRSPIKTLMMPSP
ncbi:hypothetical protein IV203_038008 [Nitzschia inconspicua]|uniref:Uncharacterized protein n=1 Tax=Nitzschia inconspicua TaxID=303405 RepID=A0A9K3LLS5_9STRA|nr:hypothetical protein IV203_038008 [Nitzschia inconspicua]